MNFNKILIAGIVILFLVNDIVICEVLTLDQKLDIFIFNLNLEDEQFNSFLLQNIVEILSNLSRLNTEENIKLYIKILEASFYKN